jgi:hypothetical protein
MIFVQLRFCCHGKQCRSSAKVSAGTLIASVRAVRDRVCVTYPYAATPAVAGGARIEPGAGDREVPPVDACGRIYCAQLGESWCGHCDTERGHGGTNCERMEGLVQVNACCRRKPSEYKRQA